MSASRRSPAPGSTSSRSMSAAGPWRWVGLILAGTLALGGWQSCSPSKPAADTSKSASKSASPSPTPSAIVNDMAQNSAHHVLPIDGENFDVKVDYFCTSYDASKWQTLEAKAVSFSVHLVPKAGLPDQPRVVVTQFQAVTTLVSSNSQLNGYVLSTTSDNAAGSGYLISDVYPYEGTVSIAGYTTALADQWRSVTGKTNKLDEKALVASGVYANKMTFTVSLVVTNFGDTAGHKRTINDALTIVTTTR
jgi:hypothetical protein